MAYEFVPLSQDTEEDSKPYSFVPLEVESTTQPAAATEEPGIISRAWEAAKGTVSSIIPALTEKVTPYKSVLEGAQLTPQETQAELNKRLGYGAGPVSLETVAKADEMRAGKAPVEPGPAFTVAVAREKAKEPTFFDLVDRAQFAATAEEREDSARRKAVAEESPLLGAVGASAASSLAGAINIPTVAAQLFNETAVNPVLQAMGLAPLPKVGKMFGTEYLSKVASDYMPDLNKRSVDGAIAREEFGKWLGVKMAANSVSAAQSLAAVYAPPLRAVLLPSMGATAAGQSYAGGEPASIAAAKGLIEVGTEMLPLGVIDKISDVLKSVSPLKQSTILAVAGQRLMQTGGQVTAVNLTNAIEETAAQLGGNVLDKYFQGKDIELTNGLKEAAIVGAASGSIIAAPQTAGILTGRYEPQAPDAAIARAIEENVRNAEWVAPAQQVAAERLSPYEAGPNVLEVETPAIPQAEGVLRRQAEVQAYDQNVIQPTREANLEVAREALGQATNADDAAAAAGVMAGSLDELIVPGQAVTPLPIEPTLTAESLPGEMPAFGAPAIPMPAVGGPAIPMPAVNPETEQRFGLDKLRMNAPRPQRIQGQPVADLTDDQLTTISQDETVPAITRRSAAVELTARQAEQTAAQAAIETPARAEPAPAPEIAPAPQIAVQAPAIAVQTPAIAEQTPAIPVQTQQIPARTYTQAELGQMRLGDRRTLAREYDQTENPDGSITFTPKSAAPTQAAAPSAAPAAESFIAVPDNVPGAQAVSDATASAVAGIADATRARTAAQAALDSWAASSGVTAPRLNAPTPELETAVGDIAQALGSQFSGRVVAFNDPSPSAPNGLAIGGTAFVNTATDVNVMRTSLHEFKHTVEQIAAAETKAGLVDTPAQKFTASIDGVFNDMTDEGKRAYLENFLAKDELDAIGDPIQREERLKALLTSDTLKSEMTADFLGNRATDKRFWASVAKADPQGFKGFVDKWVGIIDNLLNTLRGKPSQRTKESAKVDQYIRDLNKAKMVARDALVAYRNGTLQQFAPTTAPAMSMVQGEQNARGIVTPGGQGVPGPAIEAGQLPGAERGGEVPSYGTARQGAVTVVGRHYSTAARQSLSGAFYGRGLKGAERSRLDSSPDPRLKNRIYFYVDKGAGIRPEAGVGGIAHEVQLTNIYDPTTRLVKPQADANAFESAVINAGFDGYIAPFGNNQAAVVLLGMKHKAVPVKAIGAVPSAAPAAPAAPTTLKKGLMSRELNAIDTSRVPGSQVRMGNLEVPADQVEAANAELARIGSEARFSRRQKTQTVGDYEVATEKDGSIKVLGDSEEIRGLMPEGVVGRPVSDGVVFTNAAAPRVRAALEGRKIAYSRGGAVLERLPVKDGKYLGAPEKFNTPAKIPTLRRWLRQLANEGAPGRYWYENSGREVLKMVGGDVQEARKFVALLAIYSPQAKVDANSTFALRAWSQYKAGQPISVKTGTMDAKAKNALDHVDEFWSGEKTGNFFFNLLREIDPTTQGKQGATIDMWMMRAGQYSNDAPTATQYAFMENETNRLAQELGWEPQQVQAAIWVAMKARMENTGVKKSTEALSEKKGWIKFERDEDGKKVRKIIDEQKHRDNWLKHSFEHDPTKDDTQQAKFDFGDGLKRHIGQVSFEARPGRSTGVLPGIHNAPYSQQVEFHQAVQKAFYDEQGNDLLAMKLGLLVDTSDILAPGVWQGEVSPSSQKLVAMAPAKGAEGKTKVDPAQAQALNLYAAVAGLVAKQEGVGWHRPFYAGTKRDSNGLDINLGRVINPAEAKDLEAAIGKWMADNGKDNWQDSMALISSPTGVRVVSFGIIDNPTLHTDLVKVAESALPDFDFRVFASDGDMPTNNWKENPNGESYVQRIGAAGRSDVLDWARTVLAPRVQRVFTEFSDKYGWGNPGSISFSKREAERPATGAEAIFDGLSKRGLAKTRAQAALESHPDSARITFVQDNFLDILSELDDSGLVKINCD